MYEEPEEIAPEEPPAEAVEEPEPAAPPKGTWSAARLPWSILYPSRPEDAGHFELLSHFLLIFTDSKKINS